MSKKSRKRFRKHVQKFFETVEQNPLFLRILNWPRIARWLLSIFLAVFGFIGILSPIPGGWIMMTGAAIIIWGINPVKETSIRLLLKLKVHKIVLKISRFFRSS